MTLRELINDLEEHAKEVGDDATPFIEVESWQWKPVERLQAAGYQYAKDSGRADNIYLILSSITQDEYDAEMIECENTRLVQSLMDEYDLDDDREMNSHVEVVECAIVREIRKRELNANAQDHSNLLHIALPKYVKAIAENREHFALKEAIEPVVMEVDTWSNAVPENSL